MNPVPESQKRVEESMLTALDVLENEYAGEKNDKEAIQREEASSNTKYDTTAL